MKDIISKFTLTSGFLASKSDIICFSYFPTSSSIVAKLGNAHQVISVISVTSVVASVLLLESFDSSPVDELLELHPAKEVIVKVAAKHKDVNSFNFFIINFPLYT